MIFASTILPRHVLGICLAAASLLLTPFATGMAQPSYSNTDITVTTLVDEDDGVVGTGAGTSLREAVKYSGSGDRILFGSLSGTIFLTLGELVVSHDLIIEGPGAEVLEVNGNDLQRIFLVNTGFLLRLEDLTLASGRAVDGAAILSQGGLWLSGLAIRWSTAIHSGGAIYHNNNGILSVANCRFEHCDAYNEGGAIAAVAGTVGIGGSSFEANTAGGDGGAVYLNGSAAQAVVLLSSFSRNTAANAGGGIAVGASGNLLLTQCTVDENRAAFGGGIYNFGTLGLTLGTVSGNSADHEGGGIRSSGTAACNYATIARNDAESGGGIYNSGSLTMQRTLVAENTAAGSVDIDGTVTSLGNNLAGIGAGSSGWIGSDLVGTASEPMNAALDDLRMNGGATKTHALLTCSRAIDAAVTDPAIIQDQRGLPREVNGDHDTGAQPDIGAFELQSPLDNTPPVINEHPAFVVYLDAAGTATIDPDDLLINAYDDCGILSTTVGQTTFSCVDLGTPQVTLTATDRSYNITSKNVTITVVDDIAPTLTIPSDKSVNANSAPDDCLTVVTLGSASATDNCTAIGSITISNNAPAEFPVGTTFVTWTAEDASGNKATGKQIVTVTDVTLPVVVAPANKSVNAPPDKCTVLAGLVALGTPTVTDNCSYVVTNDAPLQFPLGATVVTWTATDASGNVGTASQTVTVVDVTPPTVFAPADLLLAVGDNCVRNASTFILGAPVFSDNCSVASTTNDAVADFDYPIGQTPVTWTVTDGSGNQTQAVQMVTVQDLDPPSIVAPDGLEVEADAGKCYWTVDPTVLGTPTGITDNCVVNGIPTYERSGGWTLNVGMHRIIWTAIDAAGNRSTDVQMVTVVGEPPVLSCISGANPGDPAITDTTDAGVAGAVITYPVPTLVGTGCSNVEIIRTSELGSGDFFPVGTTTVSYMAIDGSNQIDMCSFDVLIVDEEFPKIDVKVAPRNLWPVDNKMKEIEATVVVTDNVPGATAVLTSITCNEDMTGDIAGDTLNIFDRFYEFRSQRDNGPREYTVLYTATDVAGNYSSASAVVTVPTTKPKDFEDEILPAPSTMTLAQNYPNPFNPSTVISFGTPIDQYVELRVFNAIGMPVRTLVGSQLAAGTYTIEWDGHDDIGAPLPSGVYLYMLRAGNDHLERKMILAR